MTQTPVGVQSLSLLHACPSRGPAEHRNSPVGAGVGVVGPQPFNALVTAMMISFTVMSPEPSASPIGHVESGELPNAMFTMMMSSFTVTSPLPSQSPVHPPGVGVVVGVGVGCPALRQLAPGEPFK